MDNIDKFIRDSLLEDNAIPEAVEQKCKDAFESVRQNDSQPLKKKKYLAAKICLPIAASIAIVFGFCFTHPAFAAQIPVIKDIFQMFQTDQNLNDKDDLVKGDQGKYAKPVSEAASQAVSSEADSKKGIDLKVQQYSCDGTNLYVTYIAKVIDPKLADCDGIEIDLYKQDIDKVNGQEIHSDTSLYLQRIKDGSFVAQQHFDLSQYPDLPEKFNLSIRIDSLIGINSKIQEKKSRKVTFKGKTEYQSFMSAKEMPIEGTWNFSFDITRDTSHDKIYTVNQVKNGVKLSKVILTPGTTEIEYEIPDSVDSPAVTIYDNTNRKISPIGGQDTKLNGATLSRMKYAMTPKDAKSLNITVIDKNTDKVIASFTVPLTK